MITWTIINKNVDFELVKVFDTLEYALHSDMITCTL